MSADRATDRRTLHALVCYRTPAIDFSPWWFAGAQAPDESMYEHACRTCFGEPAAVQKTGEKGGRSDELDSGDDFTSDDSDDAQPDPVEEFLGDIGASG